MNSQLKRLTSKRVADFFVSVNAGIDLIQAKDSQNSNITGQAYHDITELYFSPNVTGRYPLTDRLNQQLPDGLTRFCFPNEIQLSDHSKRTTFHTFVLTSEGGARLLGCCLIYYRKVDAEQAVFLEKLQSEIPGLRPRNDIRSLYLPYCVCLISHWTFVHQFKTVMCCLHQISLTASTTPIERYICNFIDDVPAPPAGRIDVTYYLGEQAISFRCPPANEPNVWSGMPLFPLFECLSPENILALFTCVLVERQIIFVSSQYSLLTVCAEAITSLLYPITWSHAYIPILPKFLVTFVTAPFPYITGVHTSYWSSVDQSACEDAVKVFLDENRIDFGDLGAPPALPDRRARKLLQSICSAGRVFELRGDTWQEDRRPFFDDAFSTISDRPVSSIIKSEKLDESLRAAFLKFFVTLLKNYRRHLVYGSMMNKFSFEEFLAEQGTESRPFLEEMLQTQQFSEFVDSRLFEVGRDPDVVFFDESIDAKQNRKTFKLRGNIDTPFLDNVDSKHQKTYVAPSPDISNCPIEGPYLYPNGLGNLNASLYSAPRNLTPPLNSGVSTSMMHLARLKRANTSFLGSGYVGPQSAFASTYSCYIVTLSRLICYTQSHLFEFKAAARTSVQQIIEEYGNEDDMDNSTHHSEVSFDTGRIDLRAIESALVDKLDTTAQIESLLNQSQDAAPEDQQAVIDALIASPLSSPFTASGLKTSRDKHTISVIISPRDNESIIDDDTAHMEPSPLIRSNSIVTRQSRTSTLGGRKRSESSSTQQDDKDLMEAAKLALRVSLEALNCLSRLDEPADDAVFRSLAEACGCCGFAQEIIDLVVLMGDEGLVADNQMLSSVARAVSIAQGGSAALSETAGSPRLSDILVTSPRRNSVTAGTSSSLLRIVPSDVWVMQDWQWAQHAKNTLYRRKYVNSSADGSVNSNSRSMTAATYHRPSVTQLNTTSKDPIKFLQVPDSSNKSTKGTPVGIDRFVEWLLGSNNNATSPRDSSTASTPKSAVESDKMPSLTGVFGQSSRPPLARRPSRGLNLKTVEFPRLKWKWAPHETFDQSSIHWASKKLSRQVAVAENLLVGMFPSLCIDLQNPLGMSCPSPTCQLKRTLTLEEVYEGWGDDGDPNKYTTKCPNCGHAFVPRFTVMCRSKSWVGSEGPKTPLWCEFLSPWTLRKELFTVLFEEGVEHVISPSFRHPILSPQHCVLFWNALISFRLQGLPYSFLLCGRSITSAFPPLSSSVSAAGAPGSSSSTVDKVIPYVSPVMRS